MGWDDNTKDLVVTKDSRDINNILANSPSKMQSNAVFKGLDLVCEGEIEGLVNGSKSVYLDGVVLQNSDDSYNFENVTLSTRYGTADQTYIKDFNQVETPITAGMPVELISNYPASPSYIVKTITDTNVDAVRIRVGLDSLFMIKNNGDIKSAKCEVRVDVQVDGGGYVSAIGSHGAFYFSGKSKSNYERSATIDLRSFGTAVTSYDIRVYRVSADSDDVAEPNNTMNKSFLMGYTEIIRVKLTYPYCVVFGIECDAKSMGGKIPERLYHLRGRKIRVPTNYTPYIAATYGDGNTFTITGTTNYTSVFTAGATFSCNCGSDGYKECVVLNSSWSFLYNRTTVNVTSGSDVITSNLVSAERIYTGTWDGTFQVIKKWSSNNAWVYYDILSEPRACAGINVGYIDKWTLYNIGRYCDVLVEDGFGKKEPRFSFNGKIESVYDAQELFNVLAASFNAMPYWGTAIATLSQDKPTSATRLYTNANVIDGEFFYDGVALRDINTAAVVVWNNPNDLGKPEPEYVAHNYGIRRYGYREKRISTLGCNSKGQAHRIGKWILDSEVFKPDNVRFRASFDSVDLMPGEVAKIADQYYGDKRFGFKIANTLYTGVDVIGAVEFTKEIGETYNLHAVIRDSNDDPVVETKEITAAEEWGSKFGSELVTDGSMDTTSEIFHYPWGPPVTTERTTEEVYVGTYAWKIVADGADQGIRTNLFSTVSGTTYRLIAYLYPVTSPSISIYISKGDDSGWLSINGCTNLTLNAWNKIEIEGTETATGNQAYVLIASLGANTFYIDEVSYKPVTESSYTKLTIASAFSRDAVADESGIISQANDSEDNVREFKIVAVEESEKNIFEVAGVEYDSTKYARIESDLEFVEETPPSIDFTISPPTNLDLTEFTYTEGQNHLFGINVGWTMATDPRVMYYTVQFDKSSSDDTDPIDYITVALIPDPFFQIKPLDVSGSGTLTYSVRVRSEALTGHSEWVTDTVILSLDPDAPPDVTGLQVKGGGTVFSGLDCEIEWDDMSSGVTNPRHSQYRVDVYYGAVFLRTEYVKLNSFIYTFGMNNEDNPTGPYGDLIFYVWCSDIYNVLSEGSVPLTVTNDDPTNPQSLTSTSWSLSVEFAWDANTEVDFSHYEYRAKVGAALNGEAWYTVVSPHYTRLLTSDEKETYGTSATIYFEAIAVDVFGNESSVSSTNDTAASLNILPTDIITFGPSASKLFPYSPVISGLTVTDNSNDGTPASAAGYIHWSEFTIWHNSIEYTIATGSTNLFYVYWKDLHATTLSTSAESSNPLDIVGWTPLEDAVILINESGTHQKAWGNAICNQIIGSAQIMKLAVGDAHVDSLTGTKIAANTIAADRLNGGAFGTLTITSGKIVINAADGLEIDSAGDLNVKTGGTITIESAASIEISTGGGINIADGGDIKLTPSDTSPSKIIFEDSGAGTYDIEIVRNATNDRLCFYPTTTGTCQIYMGITAGGAVRYFKDVYIRAAEYAEIYANDGTNYGYHRVDANVSTSMYHNNGSGNATITCVGGATSVIQLTGDDIQVTGDIRPSVTGNFDLGTTSYRWGNLLVNGIDLNGALDIDGGIVTVDHDPGDSAFLVNIQNTRSGATPYGVQINTPNYSSGGGYYLYCRDDDESKFYIQGSGSCANRTNVYGAISDISLKENVVDCTPKLNELLQCKVRNYNLIGHSDKHLGVISQELEHIFPGLVEVIDGKKHVKYSIFVPMLIKAIQELNEKVDKLKDK